MRTKNIIILFLTVCIVCNGCGSRNNQKEKSTEDTIRKIKNDDGALGTYEKGYDLPVDDSMKEEAVEDCKEVMEQIRDIYVDADKGDALNAVIEEKTMLQMKRVIKTNGCPVIGSEPYSVMENYQKDENQPSVSYVSYTRIMEWEYTKKGWFGYKLCVPEPPEVSEIVDGSCLIRIKPLSNECRELSRKCVFQLGYQGNNILCSNWDINHMDGLDYNGMYEYLYDMKYQKKFDSDHDPNGIPKEEFESLIMEYLPITAEKIREYSVFDEESQTYVWAGLGCFNYTPNYFGNSLPEVIHIRDNEDGSVTLTVEAVCDVVMCDDTLITHELTVKFADDGSFQYLGNTILNDGIKKIPDYQYRIVKEGKKSTE